MYDSQHFTRRQGYGVTVTTDDYEARGGRIMRLRARVYIDSHAEQSHAIAEAWTDGRGWAEAYRLEPSTDSDTPGRAAFGCPSYASRDRDAQIEAAAWVARRIIEQAHRVASGLIFSDAG